MDRLTAFRCNAYTAVSEAAARFQEKMCGFPEGRLIVLPNGSDAVIPADASTVAEMKKEPLADMGKQFLESIPFIAEKLPQDKLYGFLFMGEGPYGDLLREKAEILNKKYKNIRIVFPGFRKDASSLLVMLDLFLMPSRYEGYGLALAEAFSLGIPALSSKADSLPEVCEHFSGHFLYCDPENAAETSERFLQAMKLAGFEGKIICSCDEMCHNYMKLYKNLTEKGN